MQNNHLLESSACKLLILFRIECSKYCVCVCYLFLKVLSFLIHIALVVCENINQDLFDLYAIACSKGTDDKNSLHTSLEILYC